MNEIDMDAAPADDAREMLALIEQQQRRVDHKLRSPVPWLYGIWGFAWLIGYLLLWSAVPGGNPLFQLPLVPASIVFGVLIVGAMVTSSVLGARINRGVRGSSTFSGVVYGISWPISGFALYLFGAALKSQGLPDDAANLYFSAVFGIMAGILYLAGAALWNDRLQLIVGLIVLFGSAASPFAGLPNNFLVLALTGGPAFLAAAILSIRARRR